MEKYNDAKRFQYVLMSGLDRAFSRCKKLKKVQPKEMPWFDSEIVLQKGLIIRTIMGDKEVVYVREIQELGVFGMLIWEKLDGVDDRYERRHDDMGGENAENELKSSFHP
uniref:Uncharacterized protein n=1 Tax=Tanacetum cinerariifolium TaxID=118510 RepID=A0A6L2N401_TANCI|nr:hypothetical protein [Tanacetum cinerariifolium]